MFSEKFSDSIDIFTVSCKPFFLSHIRSYKTRLPRQRKQHRWPGWPRRNEIPSWTERAPLPYWIEIELVHDQTFEMTTFAPHSHPVTHVQDCTSLARLRYTQYDQANLSLSYQSLTALALQSAQYLPILTYKHISLPSLSNFKAKQNWKKKIWGYKVTIRKGCPLGLKGRSFVGINSEPRLSVASVCNIHHVV